VGTAFTIERERRAALLDEENMAVEVTISAAC
jgi:hypothetical protein